MNKHTASQLVSQATDGVLGTITDLVLYELFFTLSTTNRYTFSGMDRARADADKLLAEFNYQSLKNSLYSLIKKDYVKKDVDQKGNKGYILTQKGSRRIENLLPVYQTDRKWSGSLFLISYDIPSGANNSRNNLRDFLKDIKCALLQESLWLSVYDPRESLSRYIKEENVPGTILVSTIGKDGSVGRENLSDLIRKIYRLDALAIRYAQFLNRYHSLNPTDRTRALITYQGIVKDDPQLPYALEPDEFPGKKAHALYQKILAEN
jgi:DNA-binding transcriptional regulator PaaX